MKLWTQKHCVAAAATFATVAMLTFGLVSCGAAGIGNTSITVEVTFSGVGVDQARIIRDPRSPEIDGNDGIDESDRQPGEPAAPPPEPFDFEGDEEVVDLPWSTTITIDRSGGDAQEFSIIAINDTESGTLRCAADFEQAEGDGSWDRENSYIVGCSGEVRFDGSDVTLEPGGRSVSFTSRDERIAENQAEIDAEATRVAELAEARSVALAVGTPVEIDGWRITPTGVNRDAAAVLVNHNQTNRYFDFQRAVLVELDIERIASDPGRPSAIAASIVGGFTADLYDVNDDDGLVDCGLIPGWWGELPGQFAQGDQALLNVCAVVEDDDAAGAWLMLGTPDGPDTVQVLLPDTGVTGGREVADPASAYEPFEIAGFTLQVLGYSVDDIDELTKRNGGTVGPIPDDETYVLIDVSLRNDTDVDTSAEVGIDWRLMSADGSTLYEFDTTGTECRRTFGFLPTVAAEDAFEFTFLPQGETTAVGACWALPREALDGALLQFEASNGSKEIVTLDIGL